MRSALPHRPLGTTGLSVAPIGLGTVKLGRNTGVKYPRSFNLPSDQDIRTLLSAARDLGINLLDTAPAYGTSEARLGELLESRANWVLCTKVGEFFDGQHSHFDFSAKAVQSSVEASLRRLRTDWLDLVLVHSDGNDLEILQHTDCVETLQRLKQAGFIRAVGFSGKTVAGGLQALRQCDAVMVTYHPAAPDEGEVIDAAAVAGKGVLIKKGLQSGHLEGDTNADPVQRNLDFIFARAGVHCVVTGTLNPLHLIHNAECAARALRRRGLI